MRRAPRFGERAEVLEDVVTTGGSVLETLNAVRLGLTVVQVIILVDREERGRQTVKEQVFRVQAVFTLSQLRGSR